MSRAKIQCAGVVLLASALSAPSVASIIYTTVALSGTDGALGPGMGVGVTFSGLGGQQPMINSGGQVSFRGNSSQAGTPQGMWVHTGASNANVAIAGGARPGGGTYTSGTTGIINSMMINDAGDWAMRLGASTGLFATASGVPTRVMLTGDAAPGAGGASYSGSASGMPLMNNAGQVGYMANLGVNATSTPPVVISGATANASALWVGAPGSGSMVLRQNDTVTAIDPGGSVRINAISSLGLRMNGSGKFAIQTTLQGTVTTGTGAGSNSAMVATNRGGSLEVVARVGDASPNASGVATADLYRSLNATSVAFNDAARIAFTASLRNAAGTQTVTSALFTDLGTGVVHAAARQGDAVPAITGAVGSEFAGATWSSFSDPVMNGAGTLALSTSITNVPSGTTALLVTMAPSGVFTKVARSGDVAIPGGAPLGGDAFFTSFSSISMNSTGQMAFSALLNGSGISGGPGGNNSAIFGYDPSGSPFAIARTSDFFEVAPGDFRQISALGGLATTGGQDGRIRNLNENGDLTFTLDFTDGSSGVFVAHIPSVGLLPTLGLGGLIAARRRR